jgi:hypothetical protein
MTNQEYLAKVKEYQGIKNPTPKDLSTLGSAWVELNETNG